MAKTKRVMVDGVDCTGMTDDPKKSGTPLYLQTQNRKPLTTQQQQKVDEWFARAKQREQAISNNSTDDELAKQKLREELAAASQRKKESRKLKRMFGSGDWVPGAVWDTKLCRWTVNGSVISNAGDVTKQDRSKVKAAPSLRTGLMDAHAFAKLIGCEAKLVRRALRSTKAIPKPAYGWYFPASEQATVCTVVQAWLVKHAERTGKPPAPPAPKPAPSQSEAKAAVNKTAKAKAKQRKGRR